MMSVRATLTFLTPLLLFVSSTLGQTDGLGLPEFIYDEADQTIPAVMLDSPEYYDAGVAVDDEGTWVAWLEFVPGEGDRLLVGRREADGWAWKETIEVDAARIARPTLTVDADGRLWLTYEAARADDGQWDVFFRRRNDDGTWGQAQGVSPSDCNDINHRTAVDPTGGLWIAWQSDVEGQFDVLVAHLGDGNGPVESVSQSPRGDWRPSIAVTPQGRVCVAWDSYDGQSFNVLARQRIDGQWGPISAVAATPALEDNADLAVDGQGNVWILWQQGGQNWGQPYRSSPGVWDTMTDTHGPLHRFRTLHLAVLTTDDDLRHPVQSFPMPSLDAARTRRNLWPGASQLGVFYERGRLVVDGAGRPWVVYRHFYHPHLGVRIPVKHHIEKGWRIFARCLQGDGWSKLQAFDVPQRDGTQRLDLAPLGDGLTALWTTGRTDRRNDPRPRGLALGVVHQPITPGALALPDSALTTAKPAQPAPVTEAPREPLAPAVVGDKTYHLVRGDLHRHTDLSLCRSFVDGSVAETYRYAIEVARLDFLGITDHTRDLAHGDRLSQLWRRSTKEVTRHRLSGTFFPYFSFERSHGATDHNVISLRDDRIRDFPPPLPEFWAELARDTFTIPHAPINMRAWDYQNDALRPLVEIYQGCRDYSSQAPVHVALNKGYHLGFIASSDHLSTGASFACVWTPEVAREPIFRSMQARRTFGATDRIRLVFTSGDHWMGEQFTAAEIPEFRIEIDGTGPIAEVVIYDNGVPTRSLALEEGATSVRATYRPDQYFGGEHYVYVYMTQTDGNQAWSSPIWVDHDNPNPSPQAVLGEKLESMTNLARGKPVTASFSDPSVGKPELVTDGKFDHHLGHGEVVPEWVQIDLGEEHQLAVLRVWHYWRDGRAYRGNRLSVSATGRFEGEQTVIFDSQTDGMYPETEQGRLFVFEPVRARYVRNWLLDNTNNPSRQWVEIEAYGAVD